MAGYNLGEARGKIILEADLDGLKKGKQGLDDFKDASETAAQSPQKISGAFVAGMAVVGTAVSQATSVLINSVESWVSEAVAASDATDKFRKAMEFAGVDGAAIDQAAARAQDYADKTVYSLSDIMNAVAQFTSNGVKDANGLVESIGNLNAVAGGSPETFQRMLLAITQTTAAGKLTTENWNQIADAIPGGAGVLMKALEEAGAYTGNFRDAMSEGEITAEELNTAISSIGNKPVAVEAAESVTTMEGAIGNLNATIVGGLTKAIDFIKPALTSLLTSIGQTLEGVFAGVAGVVSYVQDNIGWIGPLAAAIGGATAAWVAWNAAITTWQNITKVATAVQTAFNAVMAANPIMLVVMAVAALVAGLIYFFTQTEVGRQIWQGFMTWLQEAWTNISSFLTTVWTNISTVVTTVWNSIMAVVGVVVAWFQTYVWPIIQFVIDAIVAYFQMYYNVVSAIWNAIMVAVGAVVNWFMENVYPTIKAVVDFLVALFNFLWQVVVAAWNGIVNAVRPVVDGFVSWLSDVWQGFQTVWSVIWDVISRVISTVWNAIRGFVEPIVQGIVSFISNTWNGLIGIVGGIFNAVGNAIRQPLQNAIDFIGTIKNTVIGFFSGAGDWLFDAGKSIIQGFLDGLKAMLGGITSFFNGLTNMIPKIKGPPERDKILLTDNGKLIMKSLYNGLASEMGDVEDLLNGMNATIPMTLQTSLDQAVNLRALAAPQKSTEGGAPGVVLYQTNNNPIAEPASVQTDKALAMVGALSTLGTV